MQAAPPAAERSSWHSFMMVAGPCLQLIAAGANVNHMSRAPETGSPLHEAAAAMLLDMVQYLLQHNANPFVENVAGTERTCAYRVMHDLVKWQHYHKAQTC